VHEKIYKKNKNFIIMQDGKSQAHSGTEKPGTDVKVTKGETSQFPEQDTNIKNKTEAGKHSGYRQGRLLSFEQFCGKGFDKNGTIEKETMKGEKNGDSGTDVMDDEDKTAHNKNAVK
jgi:hypothetical protein